MTKLLQTALLATGLAAFLALPGTAATITVDENGHGTADLTTLLFSLGNDPGPGGLNPVLTYALPFTGTQGDVHLLSSGGGYLDVIRFNGDGTLIYYSDNLNGIDSLADTPSAPGVYANFIEIPSGEELANFHTSYTPQLGQPGYDESHPSYVFIDGDARSGEASTVPEPSSLLLLGGGIAALALKKLRS